MQGFDYAPLNLVSAFQDIITQLSHVEMVEEFGDSEEKAKNFGFQLRNMKVLNPAEADRRMGVCPIPLYEFSPEEVEIFYSGNKIEAAQEILKKHNMLQYFFPAPDQLTLALIEKGNLTASDALNQLRIAPTLGHPFGEFEIVRGSLPLGQIVQALQDKKLVVEGELGYELTKDGDSARATVRFTSREGFLHKLSRVFTAKIDVNLSDLIKPQ